MKNHDHRISRRAALQAGAAGGLLGALTRTSFGMAPPWMQASNHKVLTIFLRGGYDICNTVIPNGDAQYNTTNRPTLYIPPASSLPITGNSYCRLHPALLPLQPLINAGRMVFAHATGNPARTGSHFEDQRIWETGITGCTSFPGFDPEEGWVTRTVDTLLPSGFTAASLSSGPQQLFRTRPDAAGLFFPKRILPHIRSIRDFPNDATPRYTLNTAKPVLDAKLRGSAATPTFGLRALFGSGAQANHTKDSFARKVGLAMLDSEGPISTLPSPYVPLGGALYPFGHPTNPSFPLPTTVGFPSNSNNVRRFFMYLRDAIMLLRFLPDVRIVGIEVGSFDTHSNQGSLTGQMAELLQAVSYGIASLDTEAQDPSFEPASLTTLAFSEFGRTSSENSTLGTDHGGASCVWIAGSRALAAAGGDPVHNGSAATWPGMYSANDADFGCNPVGNTLPKTYVNIATDFRAVFGEVLRDVFNATTNQIDQVIPGYIAGNLAAQELGCIA